MDDTGNAPDLDKILQRIRKCLALSRSPEPHEAAAALRQAQKLMEKFGVSERDVSLAEVRESQTPAGRTTRCPPAWLSRLADAVSASFGTSHYYQVHPGHACYYMFVGVGPRAEVAGYAFAVLRRQCTAARRTYYTELRGARSSRTRRADAYATGWVCAVAAKVSTFAQATPAIVGEYLRERRADLAQITATQRSGSQDMAHVAKGWVDGQAVELHPGVAGNAPPALAQ